MVTCRRIANGVMRYVVNTDDPFIVNDRTAHIITVRNAGKPFTAANEPTHYHGWRCISVLGKRVSCKTLHRSRRQRSGRPNRHCHWRRPLQAYNGVRHKVSCWERRRPFAGTLAYPYSRRNAETRRQVTLWVW